MGVQLYLFDSRRVLIRIGSFEQTIGTLRRFFKITELNAEREQEIEHVKAEVSRMGAPPACMIAEPVSLPLADDPDRPVSAHLVLSWDSDQASVNDFDWNYLPALGYGVRTPAGTYILHESRSDLLYPITDDRAFALGILDQSGKLIRRGQPTISACSSVRPFISGFVEAKCVLADNRKVDFITHLAGDESPEPDWYLNKRPSDIKEYPRSGT